MDRIKRGSQIRKENQDTASASLRATVQHGLDGWPVPQRKRPNVGDSAAFDKQPSGIFGICAQPAAVARTCDMDHAHLVFCDHGEGEHSDI